MMCADIEKAAALKSPTMQLAMFRRTRRDIGSVILSVTSSDLIDGVEIEPFQLWPDDRGFFAELFRFGQPGVARDFTGPVQVSTALSHAGTVKAIHFHSYQTDLWVPIRGMFQVVLFDLRIESPTFGRVNTLYVGELRPWKLRIPPGVGHGYKIVGGDDAQLVYATNQFYNPSDEGRIPYNDSDLNYDWEVQHK